MSSADPGAGRHSETNNVRSSGPGSSSFGTVGHHATFKWVLRRPLTHVAWLPVSACLVIAATAAFAVFAVVRWPGGPQSQYVWFYVLAALALLLAGTAALYPAARPWQVRDDAQRAGAERRRRTVRTALVALAALSGGGGGLAWVDVDRTGEVGVEMAIRGTQPVDDTGGTLTVVMAPPAPDDVREKLRLTLTIKDDDPNTPACVGRTTARITAVTPGITPHSREVPAHSTRDFDLGGREGAVLFSVAMSPGTGCSMRLAQARGTLHND